MERAPTDSTPFLRAYERLLLTYGTDYHDVRHEHTSATIAEFYAPYSYQARGFETRQDLDYPALEGRLRVFFLHARTRQRKVPADVARAPKNFPRAPT